MRILDRYVEWYRTNFDYDQSYLMPSNKDSFVIFLSLLFFSLFFLQIFSLASFLQTDSVDAMNFEFRNSGVENFSINCEPDSAAIRAKLVFECSFELSSGIHNRTFYERLDSPLIESEWTYWDGESRFVEDHNVLYVDELPDDSKNFAIYAPDRPRSYNFTLGVNPEFAENFKDQTNQSIRPSYLEGESQIIEVKSNEELRGDLISDLSLAFQMFLLITIVYQGFSLIADLNEKYEGEIRPDEKQRYQSYCILAIVLWVITVLPSMLLVV